LGGVIFLSLGGFLTDLSWRFPFLVYGFALMLLPLMLGALFEPPSLDQQLLKVDQSGTFLPIKPLSLIYSIAFLQMLLFYLIPVQLPFYLLRLTQASAKESGIAIAFVTLFSAIASMLYGRVKKHFNFEQVVAIAFVVVSFGYGIISLAPSYGQVILGLAISGLGFGTLMPNLNVWLTHEVSILLRGRALGGLNTAFFLGQFLSPIVTQPISEQVGFGQTYGIASGVLLVLGLGFWGLTRGSGGDIELG
jgi:MFS family permease